MTRFDLEKEVRNLGCTYMHHQAMSGSEYVTINGVKYRLSDHKQPSHYQVRNYIDCSSNQQIFDLVVQKIEQSKLVNTWDQMIYVDSDGGYFIENPNYKAA